MHFLLLLKKGVFGGVYKKFLTLVINKNGPFLMPRAFIYRLTAKALISRIAAEFSK